MTTNLWIATRSFQAAEVRPRATVENFRMRTSMCHSYTIILAYLNSYLPFSFAKFDNRYHRGTYWAIDNLRFRTFDEQPYRHHEAEGPTEGKAVVHLNYPVSDAESWFPQPSNKPELVINANDTSTPSAAALESL